MRAFSNYKAEKAAAREPLPAGGYVARILNAEVVTYKGRDEDYEKLVISFEISEGPYKDFFQKDYDAQTGEDRKWRGVLRLNVPVDDGSERDGWSKRSFGNAMWAVEASNPGYHWDWNEAGLRGKTVGVLYRGREWEMTDSQGEYRTGWTTECCAFESVDTIREGGFKMPKDKPLKKSPQPAIPQETQLSQEEKRHLPWET